MSKDIVGKLEATLDKFHTNKVELFNQCLNHKLNNVSNYYTQTANEAYEYLLTRSPLKVLKNIERQEKKKND